MEPTIKKVSDTEIEITTQIVETVNVVVIQANFDQATQDLTDLDARYVEQRPNLVSLVEKYQSQLNKAAAVGVVVLMDENVVA